jgi:hypothetical protein
LSFCCWSLLFNGNNNKNNDNGSNIGSHTRPALPLLILLPPLPPALLLSPIVSDPQTKRNYPSKEQISDEYIQNSKINNDLQSFNKDIVKPIPADFNLSNKLFDRHESNNFLYLEQGKNDNKKEQMPQHKDRFKCFYCDLK